MFTQTLKTTAGSVAHMQTSVLNLGFGAHVRHFMILIEENQEFRIIHYLWLIQILVTMTLRSNFLRKKG